MTRTVIHLYIIIVIAALVSCRDNRVLRQAESLLETNPAAADSLLTTMPAPTSNRDRAWYAVLKTQADYKQRHTITDDSLIITATNYYGTTIRNSERKRYMSAMAWYSQGCVYSELNNDYAAIDAYLKAKDLFPDTLIRYYALAEQKLGIHYLNRMMLQSAKQQFESCKTNAERLNDQKMFNYACVRLGLCALYDRKFETANDIFTYILHSDSFSKSHKTFAKLQKAKICLYNDNDYQEALSYVNSYLNDMRHMPEFGAGISVKADIFYDLHRFDSAFYYYNESMKHDIELYTKCSNADRLSILASKFDSKEDSYKWHELYGVLRDSINKVERAREIEELLYQNEEIITGERYAHKHRIMLLLCSSLLTFTIIILLFIYSIFKHREMERIMKKQQELQQFEKEIKDSTIELLESKIRDLSRQDTGARTILIKSYSNRMQVCTNSFRATSEYVLLSAVRFNLEELKKDEKEQLFSQLKHSYLEAITDFQKEVPNINENDILTVILRYHGLSIEQISNIFSISPDSVKKRLYRLSQRIPSDFLSIFNV